MTEYAEKENNFGLEEDYEDDLNDDVDFNEWGSNEEANDMENEELLEDENGVNSTDDEEEIKGGDNQTGHIQNKRPKEVKRKRPKNLNKIKPTSLKGPYHLDIEKLEEEYKDLPETINIIKKFPRLEYEIFNPVENKIPASKNHKFLHNLFNSNNAGETLQTFQLTREGFEEKYKTKFEEVDSNPTHGATGGRGKDTLKSGVLKIKSDVCGGQSPWIRFVLVHTTLYTVHCTLYTEHCTLYTVHCNRVQQLWPRNQQPCAKLRPRDLQPRATHPLPLNQ
jgi:hypothetical protein